MLKERLSAGDQTTPHLLDTLILVEPQISVCKRPTGKQNNELFSNRKLLDPRIEVRDVTHYQR